MKGHDCGVCRNLYHGNPPCHDCERVGRLDASNLMAARIWTECSEHGRKDCGQLVGPIDMIALLGICEVRGATEEDLDKVLELEKAMRPVLQEKARIAMGAHNAGH